MLLATILLSCSDNNSVHLPEPYQTCLPESFKEDLGLLMKSYDAFIKNNYNGDKSQFLSLIIDRKPMENLKFIESDYEIVEKLRLENFKHYIFTIDTDYDRMITVDTNKTYLKCLEKASTSGNLIKTYIQLKKEKKASGSLAVGRLILFSKTDPDYTLRLTDTIIAVELYYNILNTSFN